MSLGVDELHIKLRRNHQPHEGAFHKRPTYRIDPELRQTIGKFDGKRSHQTRMETERLQIEPQISMMARLQKEVSLPRQKKLENVVPQNSPKIAFQIVRHEN